MDLLIHRNRLYSEGTKSWNGVSMLALIRRRGGLLVLGGISTILLYCVFTMVSWAFYPGPYWPTTHYLSRLGDFIYSPFGAYFYNAGCILTGLALMPFFIGLREWWGPNKVSKILLILGQGLGLLSAVALIMIGVFSEDTGQPHLTASATFFLLNFFVLLLINIALLLVADFPKLAALYGIGIDLISMGLSFTLGGPIVEWLTVFGSLVFVGLVTIFTWYYKIRVVRETASDRQIE
ncbi:MAG: DUF998 domain-containing protein [Candidatus Thorarchaeota archaeon]|nr:DUF998 domain-containing protein [Candidatus Thorarchaeota archaeon]